MPLLYAKHPSADEVNPPKEIEWAMQVLTQWTTDDHPCEYLPEQTARLHYVFVGDLTPGEYETRMEQGWRKFGRLLFQPVCTACDACQPLRIPVARFAPSRSQRRAVQRNADDFTVRFGLPVVDAARLALYHRYHAAQEQYKGWHASEKTPEEYAFAFVDSPIPGVEISVWEGDVLRAIVLTDIAPDAVSGVYHFHDPELRDRGIGVFAMLQTVELARRLRKTWAYFGYFVADCPSLAYKARFQPCEVRGVDGVWRAYGGTEAAAATLGPL